MSDRPSAKPNGGQAAHGAPPRRFTLTRFSDIKPLDGDRDYCVKGVLPRSGLAVVWGPPKRQELLDVRHPDARRARLAISRTSRPAGTRRLHLPRRRARLSQAQGGVPPLQAQQPEDPDDPPFFLVTNPLSLATDVKLLIKTSSATSAMTRRSPSASTPSTARSLDRRTRTRTWANISRPPT